MKLVRNAFGTEKCLPDKFNNNVDWNFLVKLVEKQYSEVLHLAIKIRARPLGWAREKINVKIAT